MWYRWWSPRTSPRRPSPSTASRLCSTARLSSCAATTPSQPSSLLWWRPSPKPRRLREREEADVTGPGNVSGFTRVGHAVYVAADLRFFFPGVLFPKPLSFIQRKTSRSFRRAPCPRCSAVIWLRLSSSSKLWASITFCASASCPWVLHATTHRYE